MHGRRGMIVVLGHYGALTVCMFSVGGVPLFPPRSSWLVECVNCGTNDS